MQSIGSFDGGALKMSFDNDLKHACRNTLNPSKDKQRLEWEMMLTVRIKTENVHRI